jgi:hypothetical protein
MAATVGIDTNGDGVANYFYTGADRNNDGIPDALQGSPNVMSASSVNLSSSMQAGMPLTANRINPGVRYETVKKPSTSYIKPASIIPYKRDEKITYTYPVSPYQEYGQIVPYEPVHTFTHDFWHEVLRPLGLGIAAPVAGAGAFVGGVVCGAGALVAGCAFGVVSTMRGVFGLLPIGVDYVLKPVAYGIDGAAAGMDSLVDKATGEEKTTEAFFNRISGEFKSPQLLDVPRVSGTRVPTSGVITRPYVSTVDTEFDMRGDYFAERVYEVPQTIPATRYAAQPVYTTIG